jgi:organic hydroperoxide reductase OsmC/OhrA
MEPHIFEVTIRWTRERKGTVCSPDVAFVATERGCFDVATPPQFPKGMAGIWSPEHLFTAAIGSCLMTTFLAIAENFKLEFESFDCRAKGTLNQVEGKYLMTHVSLEPELTIANEADREKAFNVLQKSELACLISNSVKSKITMAPVVRILGGL